MSCAEHYRFSLRHAVEVVAAIGCKNIASLCDIGPGGSAIQPFPALCPVDNGSLKIVILGLGRSHFERFSFEKKYLAGPAWRE